MNEGRGGERRRTRGFTLIEVLGALVVFSVGVLMAMGVSNSLGELFRRNSVRSGLAVVGQSRLDSLGALEYDSVSVGTTVDTVTVRNEIYACTITVTQPHPIRRAIQLSLDPVDGTGPVFDGQISLLRSW